MSSKAAEDSARLRLCATVAVGPPMSLRRCLEVPWQMARLKMWQEVAEELSNLRLVNALMVWVR